MQESDLDYVKTLKDAGFELLQAEQILKVVDKKMNQNFATKHELERFRNETSIKFKELEHQIDNLKHYVELKFSKLETKFEILLTIAVGVIVAVVKL